MYLPKRDVCEDDDKDADDADDDADNDDDDDNDDGSFHIFLRYATIRFIGRI